MAKSTKVRLSDEFKEYLTGQFLDKYLYPQIDPLFKRITDKKMQVKGADVILNYNGKQIIIDEKAATDYIGKKLYTFCLELTTLNKKGEVMIGWFLNNGAITTHYLFIWFIFVKDDTLKTVEDIKTIDYALVPKEKIKEHLRKLNWTDKKLEQKAHKVRFNNDRSFGDLDINGCKISFTKTKVEEPICMLLRKEVYFNIADKCGRIKVK